MQNQTWMHVAQAYAFVGNSLLASMGQSSDVGLEPELWDEMPFLDDVEVEAALRRLRKFAEAAQSRRAACVQDVSVEYAHLFIGPPQPACPPWETYYRREGVSNGFGAATFEMREVLRQLGMEAAGSSNQFEDHAGIELLVLSELCQRMADAACSCEAAERCSLNEAREALDDDRSVAVGSAAGCRQTVSADQMTYDGFVAAYMQRHVTSWMSRFAVAVAQERPAGYHALLLDYVVRLADAHLRLIADYSN